MHMAAEEAEVDHVEGAGALNFLSIDDLAVMYEGEPVDPQSVISLPMAEGGKPVFPPFERSCDDAFLRRVEQSQKKWIILIDLDGEPQMVLDSDSFLRQAFCHTKINPVIHCHRPIIVKDLNTKLGDVLGRFKVEPQSPEDDVIDRDIVLIWGEDRRVITGADILGRLMRGIIKIK